MITITLPSGLTGEFRGLTAKDLRYLTNEKLVRDNQVEDFVLKSAWLGMTDAGPYPFTGRESVDWTKVLVGDRAFGVIAVRNATFPGEPYPARLKCGECGKSFEYDFDLEALLREKTRRLSAEDAAVYQAGNRFEARMPGTGAAFTFALRHGWQAQKLAALLEAKRNGSKQMREKVNPVVDAMAHHIVTIEGLAKCTQETRFDYLEGLSMGDFHALVELIQSHDCGVDTDVPVECTRCGAEQEVSLPFGQRGFFNPAAARKSRTAATTVDVDEESDDPS